MPERKTMIIGGLAVAALVWWWTSKRPTGSIKDRWLYNQGY